MASQKIPLFGGLIQPAQVGPDGVPVFTPIFTPPDRTSKAPQTYEVHLWMKLATSAVKKVAVFTNDNQTGKLSLAWGGISGTQSWVSPIKVLDGYPVRGDVTLALGADAAIEELNNHAIALWGYYVPVGQGVVKEEQRRPIGQPLPGFAAGVPFLLSTVQPPPDPLPPGTPTTAIVHIFEPGRIDEISLAFAPFAQFGNTARLTLEKADNTPVFPDQYIDFIVPSGGGGTGFSPLGPPGGVNPPGPYVIYKLPLGGHPDLHHLRVEARDLEGGAGLAVHGFFIRR